MEQQEKSSPHNNMIKQHLEKKTQPDKITQRADNNKQHSHKEQHQGIQLKKKVTPKTIQEEGCINTTEQQRYHF